jgi:hypothetical protein
MGCPETPAVRVTEAEKDSVLVAPTGWVTIADGLAAKK